LYTYWWLLTLDATRMPPKNDQAALAGATNTDQGLGEHLINLGVTRMKTTQLAHGSVTNADQLTVELVEPPELPPMIRVRWPDKPSIVPPAQFDAAVAAAMRILSNAVVELAAIRVHRRL
jgi:hypothetical protein